MATLEDFENILKEVVGAKRLSASKMNKLTEIAMKSLEDDTKLVAILYRTHNSLPSSAKVSSLYAFDALARAARGLVNKRGTTGDVNTGMGNAATFLLKMEGVLDGLFRGMVSLDNSEAKEKAKKVHDIWVKSNTFPSAVLARLRDILSDVQKETAVNPTTPTDPPTTMEVVAMVASQPSAHLSESVPDVQATLLALLGQAAQGHSQPPSQISPNTDPQLQPTQLALLQRLALTAKLANGSTSPPGQTLPSIDVKPPAISAPAPPHSSSWPTQADRLDIPGDARHSRNDYSDRVRDSRDERQMRGGARGGHRARSRWDGHHGHDRFRNHDRDWHPPSRPRRSRSRSPRRHEERRNVRPYSPPRRPLNDRDLGHQPRLPTLPTSTHDKDEFGREIRASSSSPSRSTPVEDTQALAPMDSSVDSTAGAAPDNHIPVSDQLPLVAASTSAQSTETRAPSSATQPRPGLDQFDVGSFDATAPSSWEGLGNMWQSTYGYLPSQEELMHFVMTESMAAAGVANSGFNGAQGGQWQQRSWEEPGPGHNGGWPDKERGSYAAGREGHHSDQDMAGYPNAAEQSDAIVLNGDVTDNDQSTARDEQGELHNPTGRAGGMRRVGDKWMYVREDAEGCKHSI